MFFTHQLDSCKEDTYVVSGLGPSIYVECSTDDKLKHTLKSCITMSKSFIQFYVIFFLRSNWNTFTNLNFTFSILPLVRCSMPQISLNIPEYIIPCLIYTLIKKSQGAQSYTYQVLQTIQMKLILLGVWAEPAVLGSTKTALKFIYKI